MVNALQINLYYDNRSLRLICLLQFSLNMVVCDYGQLFLGNGRGRFTYVPQRSSGLKITGEVRSVVRINDLVLVGQAESEIGAYRVNRR